MLFYVGCIIALVTHQAGVLVVGLAWAFVAARLVHTAIHLGPNTVIRRFQVFGLSMMLLLALWSVILIGLVSR